MARKEWTTGFVVYGRGYRMPHLSPGCRLP